MKVRPHALLPALFVIACDPPTPTPVSETEPSGIVKYAIGSDVRHLAYDEVRCTPEGELTRVELFSNRTVPDPQGRPQRPRVLIARLNADAAVEAHVFAPQVVHRDVEYEMLQLIADPDLCRLERAGEVTLACEETTVVPWLASGERPRPAFEAKFRCP